MRLPQSICPRAICRLPDAASRRRPGLRPRRVKALSGLLRGENMLVTVSAAALLQRLTPPGALRAMTTEIRAGEVVKPQALLQTAG